MGDKNICVGLENMHSVSGGSSRFTDFLSKIKVSKGFQKVSKSKKSVHQIFEKSVKVKVGKFTDFLKK